MLYDFVVFLCVIFYGILIIGVEMDFWLIVVVYFSFFSFLYCYDYFYWNVVLIWIIIRKIFFKYIFLGMVNYGNGNIGVIINCIFKEIEV